MLADFNTLPEESRIWIYASEKALTRRAAKPYPNLYC